jgi:hypothetical protein
MDSLSPRLHLASAGKEAERPWGRGGEGGAGRREARTTTRAEELGPRIHGVTAVELLRAGNGQNGGFMVSPGRFEHFRAGNGQGGARHDGKEAGAPVRRSVGRKGGGRSAGSAAVELPGGGGQQARRRR